MKYIFYDLGAFNGEESFNMRKIFQELNIEQYEIHTFEPCTDSYNNVKKLLSVLEDSRVHVHQLAISNKNMDIPLYYSFPGNEVGHSIFASKNNVDSNKYEMVKGVKFSDWLKENVSDLETSFNILKFNIEGAEYFLLKELIDTGLLKYFKIICGDPYDVLKIGDLQGRINSHNENIKKIFEHLKMEIFSFSTQSNNLKEIEDMNKKMKELLLNANQ